MRTMKDERDGSRSRPRRAAALWTAAALAALALALVIATPGTGGAQQTVESTRAFVERTGEMLQQVSEAVRESESERARRVLGEARLLHDRSVRLLGEGRWAMALQASRQARESILSAGRLARASLTYEERAKLQLERLLEYRDAVRERARDARAEEALRFVGEADRQLERAREQYGQKNFELAFSLLQSAESLLNRAARLLFERGGEGRLEQELEQTGQLIERAREQARRREDRAALDLGERAQAELDRAREAVRQGEPWRALRLAALARRLASQALESGQPAVTADAVRELIGRWDERRAELEPRAEGNRRAQALIDRAAGHRRRAGELLGGGGLEEALRQIKIAHDLLSEAGEQTR